jgi:drug/metabolite transporter (DMT)-like permease
MSFVLFLRGLATLGPIRVSIISTAEPLFAALLAAAVLHQPITLSLALGGVLVVIAVLLLQGRN